MSGSRLEGDDIGVLEREQREGREGGLRSASEGREGEVERERES